jgi:hypothetical protein
MIFRACATSASLGENAALHAAIWFGWITVLPSNPMPRTCSHSR